MASALAGRAAPPFHVVAYRTCFFSVFLDTYKDLITRMKRRNL
jgi:hypothetical protein